MVMLMRRAVVGVAASALVTLIVFSVWIASAVAADPPKVTATVTSPSPTSRLVHIVNRDHVTYRNFIVETQNTPKLVAVNKPCAIERDLGFIGTVYRYRYRAVCKKAVAPGKTFDIRLTTSGSGRVNVFVVVKDVLSRINK
jgi:hypothetical protein